MKKDISITAELPQISFSRAKLLTDCVIDNIEFCVSAETSTKAMTQFKRMLQLLDKAEKKQAAIEKK